MAEPFTLYKLIVLYILNKVDFPLTNSQISEFILDKGYTNYFKIQQVIAELKESGFIREEAARNRTLYHLTEEGHETLQYFKNDISPAIQQDIEQYLSEKQYELKNEVSVKADYYRNTNMEYSVRCQVIESGLPLIDLTITVPTEAEAEKIAVNWEKKNQEIYAYIMAHLL
ncbi:DUF4364 family protein [Dorea acetigenes]|jgi:DNA-binding PadR family transcriptional regulator|uniref:DUF4364 family protein n=1 Tax=Dorea acetigenes TaxID=2981787 RepID=A0ABT2RRJ6_9FIRM|nr:DUF4364 family protein [Dorea acetigenes]MCB6413470.1 DUF4364 family protein [Faecalimonas umbilicata]MCU6687995.1 DUF4364 family protein [Dorea acetigenes]SCJ62811.1 Uncharacterised protein [uncultured Clostridium sp.]